MAYRPRNNTIVDKSFYLAVDIVKFSKVLKENKDFEIASQLIRAGTSVGANVRESQRGASTKDFANKLKIALKEAEEVEYWLDIIDACGDYDLTNLYKQIDEVIRLLVSIIKTSGNSKFSIPNS